MIRWADLGVLLVIVSVSAVEPQSDQCKKCDAHGQLREPNKAFTYQENCREYLCKCECSGDWDCPPERVETFCQPSNPQCGTCWAGGAMQQGDQDFKFTEGCYQYNCFCNCDGAWNCPSENTVDICNYNITTGCHYCDVYGNKYQGNSRFKHVNGCIEYDCTCNCDGSWNCPGEQAIDTCNINQETGCYYCDVYGKRYEGNSHFVHVNGCIEYKCACNCDGSWDCPGDRAVDTCRTNRTTGCYYCDVYGYLYEGGTTFPLIEKCFQYKCDCKCDGGWNCTNSIGRYACDAFGNEPISECRSCDIDGTKFRGDSRFYYQKGCITYKCTCDCGGRYYCPGHEAFYTCGDYQKDRPASLSSSYTYVYTEHTRPPRQVSGCLPCYVDNKRYDTYQKFTRQVGCNEFTCTCLCDGTPSCPPDTIVNKCLGPTGGGSGASTFGSEIDPDYDLGVGISTCSDCRYRGVRYEGNSPFSFESGCWKYNCMCRCNGSIDCPSASSEYICPGRIECIKCKVDDRLIDANSVFELRRGCVYYDRCRCNCDGGWTCDDGEFTCDLCQGCAVDGRTYAGNSSFQLTRGCDKYKSCYCGCDSNWKCSGEIDDLCGECRKCNIGNEYYEGDTSFRAQVGCTTYQQCDCKCDGTYKCVRGYYTCGERGDMPVEEQCTDCVHGGRRYRPGQTFDYEESCAKYRGCQCKCGKTTCLEVEETCGNCRSCLVDSKEYRGGTKFSKKDGCLDYKTCDCFCSGEWKCYGESAIDTCNICKKCNADNTIYEPYSRFQLDRKCWKYHCFCGCDGATRCPPKTAVNTCTRPDVCYACAVHNQEYRGNTLFTYDYNGMTMSCKCNCDGSYYCIGEWLYYRTDLTISGGDLGGCFYCYMDDRRYRGDTNFTIVKNDIEMNCQCFCNGGYYCIGEKKFESTACRSCNLYGRQYQGDSEFSIVYNGLKLACQCSCDSTYLCYGTEGTAVISCIAGVGCLTQNCGQCVVQGERFNGGDIFGTTYRERDVRCECGCDGSYYCEGSGGIILSCVGGFCRELGCTSCQVFDFTYQGDTDFDIVYKGLKLDCRCQCGGNYQCLGSTGEIIVSCIDNGAGCLTDTCGMCVVDNRRYAGRSTFRFIYNGIDMRCTCSCDGSYHCVGVFEQIELSCIGGTCTRLDCKSCNIYGLSHNGDSEFNLVYGGLKLSCQCRCSSDYICMGSAGTVVVSCIGGRNCLPATCGSCFFNNKEYAGRSTFRSVYKGIDIMCTCGCDSTAFCTGITTSIEVTCIGGTCSRIGCKECSIFGREMIGLSQFDLTYEGLKLACECDCEGGYKCRGENGVVVVTCINGFGPGCLNTRCGQCVVGGNTYPGFSTFRHVYQGIDMKCSCSCDGSYHCVGVSELIEISCFGGTCIPKGCKKCRVFGEEVDGTVPFQIIYGGYLLDCKCNCDGSYECFRDELSILQCRLGVNCIPNACRSCFVNNREYRGRSTFRDVYNNIDVLCTCGCDSSYICAGVSTDLKLSCVNGRCTPVGCTNCNLFGRSYQSLQSFETIYRGMRLSCDCDCTGGIECRGSSGEVFIRCRDGVNCPDNRCDTCSFYGRVVQGLSVFKYDYQGIDMSCTCGCDGSVFCVGVTVNIELRCIDGTCTPLGCRPCSIFGAEIPPISAFNLVYDGRRIDCTCACDSSFLCLSKQNETVIDCPAGRGESCLAPTCQDCILEGTRRRGRSVFPYVFEGIDMSCTCGCDGTIYCEGTIVKIIVSCKGGACVPVGCRSCNIFGQNYPAYKPFNIIYEGSRLNCECACDSSFVCRGKSGENVVVCRAGENCLTQPCQDCVVDGRRQNARSTFPYVFEGIDMTCNCGCDGTAYCEGVREEIIVSCVGGTCAAKGCRQCSLFGQSYEPYRPFRIIYQGAQIDCTCACDTSFVCYGKSSKEPALQCRAGQQCPTDRICQDCVINGQRHRTRSIFPYQYKGIDLKCTCGCDGSAYCEGVTETIIVACIGGSCSLQGCRTCSVYGTEYQPYTPFDIVYSGRRLDCSCSCDSSIVCVDRTGEKVIDCKPGERCFERTCDQDCVVQDQRYRARSSFPLKYRDIDFNCRCGCDATAYCEGVTVEYFLSCIGQRCTRQGCRDCNLFGIDYPADAPFNVVYKETNMKCQCNCDSSWRCEGKGDGNDIVCGVGKYCLPKRCRKCRVGNNRYDGQTTFQFVYQNINMNCVCGCDGTFYCSGISVDYEIGCNRRGQCTQVGGCRKCNIFGSEYHGGSRTDFVYQGFFMTCTCNCDSSFKCVGTKGNVIVDCGIGQNCLINRCSPCRVDDRTYRGGAVFDTVYRGKNMECTCGCDGSYFCRCKDDDSELSCNAVGTCQVSGCKQCLSDGRYRQFDEEFEKYYDDIRMTCICDCDGSYRCKGVSVTIVIKCTGESCSLVGCRSCIVNDQEYKAGSEYSITESRRRLRCKCQCDGRSDCQEEVRPACVDCVIDGQTYRGHSRQRVYRNGQPYICDCFCDGRGECNPEGPACRECDIFGQRFPGNQEFETVVEGTQMRCTCDCSGSFECRGQGRTCTSAYGCRDTCPGCVIEDVTYRGDTKFTIFHKGNGITMNCDCKCGGSYTCEGKKQITTDCLTGDCSDTCKDCTFGGQTYRTNSVFNRVIDNIPMRCTCNCDGGYRCEGQIRRTNVCTGVECLRDGCQECGLDGRLFQPNTEFEIRHGDMDMHCTCACNGTLECRGERQETICIGENCANRCRSCNYEGRTIPGNSRVDVTANGARQTCTCDCQGRLTCQAKSRCTGSGCETTGCRRCIIDQVPYSGNTRFNIRKGNLDMNCTCFCDGTYSCIGSNGFEYSCLGDDCPADQCRPCKLDNRDFQLDDKFRLVKNDLLMNCVCECDGAYRCFSVSGFCTGPDCDDYGCSSCIIGNNRYRGNSKFELQPGTTCECDCSGQYSCTSSGLSFECVGARCGDGGCRTCIVDNEVITGNSRFQFKKYGLFMQCACNCDSSFICRGYQIISDGSAPIDIPCTPCIINGKKYNPMTRFQAIIDGKRKVCSCGCSGQHSCQGAPDECRNCIIGNQEYASRSDFTLYRDDGSILCRCNCNGDFVCEGRAMCQGSECGSVCHDCLIFGVRHKGGSRFYTGNNPQLLCECSCTGEYTCKGYKKVSAVFLPPKQDVTCASCYVGNNEHPGDTKFNIQRGCYQLECYCRCSGDWDCPKQEPVNVCGEDGQTGGLTQRVYYNLAGTVGSVNEPIRISDTQSTVVYRDETSTTVFGQGGKEGCATCIINKQTFEGNTAFVLQDGCLRWTCMCNCNGGWSCSSVVGADCTGPLDPFEGKSCLPCKAFSNTYPPEKQFVAADECYRYQCMCNCDGSYECPAELTIKTCADTSRIYDPLRGTCRTCNIGRYNYTFGEKFEYVFECIKYICECKCDGEYFCPASTGVRVCKTGSGSPGRISGVGSQTITETRQTFFALKPADSGSVSSSQSQQFSSSAGNSGGGGYPYGNDRSVVHTAGYGHATGIAGQRETQTGTDYSAGAGGSSGGSYTYRSQTGGSNSSSSRESGYSHSSQQSSSQGSSSSSSSYSSETSKTGTGSSYIGSASSSQSGVCDSCTVNGETVPGGRDFTYQSGCTEFNCECFCNGSYVCPPEASEDLCYEETDDDARRDELDSSKPPGCKLGNRVYTTQLFSYTENCIKYLCRCFKNGSYFCDPNKSKKVC